MSAVSSRSPGEGIVVDMMATEATAALASTLHQHE